MDKFKILGRIISRSRSRVYALLVLLLVGFFLSLGLGGWKPMLLQAREIQANSASVGNPWEYASFPVENFQAYTSGFGYRSFNGQSQFHYGLDIAAPLGSYIRNWWTGRVIELSDNTACGTSIHIQSGEWTHVYCHLMGTVESSPQGRYLIDQEGGIVLWQGQDVPVGARIGRVGMTGRTTGPHLHWGLKYGGQYIDPALVLQEMFKRQAYR